MKIVVGSTNPAKLKAAQIAVNELFPKVKVKSLKVDSGVENQPTSDKETIEGAINRAKEAQIKSNADFGIGMEGGMNKIGKHWFESGWIAVVDKDGKVGLGSSARWKISKRIAKTILEGQELTEVFEDLTDKKGFHLKEGVMGIITNGHLIRPYAYSHGVIFAFAPFISKATFWD